MKYFFCLIFLFGIINDSVGQKAAASLSTSQQQCFVELSRKVNPYANPNFFYQNKINVAKAAKFKSAGLDLQQMSRRAGGFSPLENALLSDCIITGQVVGAEELREPGTNFEMAYQIKVTERITGEKLPKLVTVKTQRPAQGFGFFGQARALQLGVGEEVLLYLEKVAVNPKSGEPKKQFEYEQISLRPGDEPTQEVLVPTARLRISKGQITDDYNRPLFSVKKFQKAARKVTAINDQNEFFTRDYCR
jgi:hypothetical protein